MWRRQTLYNSAAGVIKYNKCKSRTDVQREDTVMKKKEFLAGAALLAASSALCMKIMKKVGEKLKKQQEKGQNTGRR